jgi:hypothetical protein
VFPVVRGEREQVPRNKGIGDNSSRDYNNRDLNSGQTATHPFVMYSHSPLVICGIKLASQSTRKRKSRTSFAKRLLDLIAEPEFIRLENILSEPNFFTIVGRSHFERWHSSFLGWLLDAGGSHLLSDNVFRRFLLLLLDERCLRASGHSDEHLTYVLPIAQFSEIQVSPNEYQSSETSVAGVGRFDIFLTAKYLGEDGQTGHVNVIFELKIDSKPNGQQAAKYADWLWATHPEDINLLIFVSPTLGRDSFSTVGDERWYCLDYQLLNDKLLLPLLDHPSLNDKVKPFIIQYVKNLKTRHKGVKMAITNEEKRLALALYDRYSDVFDSIYDALVSAGTIDYSTADIVPSKGRSTGRLAVRLDAKVITNDTVRLLFEQVLRHIVDEDDVTRIPLPWGPSRSRYVLTNQTPPLHPNGREFFYPVTYKGYAMESHYARDRALKVLGDLCDRLEIEFEVIDA